MIPLFRFDTFARLLFVVLATVTAFFSARANNPLTVTFAVALTIAALAAMPREVAAYALVALNTLCTCGANLLHDAARVMATGAERVCPQIAEQFDYETTTGPVLVELRIGRQYVSVRAENFKDVTPGVLDQITRDIFKRCSALDDAYEPLERSDAAPVSLNEFGMLRAAPPVPTPVGMAG